MRYLLLACDYDGTLARDGRVEASTLVALERVRASGRKLLLLTGRQLDDLRSVFTEVELFDTVVAENGALLYNPRTKVERTIAEAPPTALVETLRRRYIPIAVGRVIVATWEPHEREVLETIRDLGLELQVIFNKGAVMVLPAGVNKGSGLLAALAALELSPRQVVGIGDAENDHAFLSTCEFAVAVANALQTIKERADVVTKGEAGAGVEELADELVASDLESWDPVTLDAGSGSRR
jgi:hydroxymethylpyrimidine pyrophosphatase-like HAD family hydrolase